MRTDIDLKKDWIIKQLLAGESQRQIALQLKCKADTLRKRLKEWGISHLKNPGRKGQPRKNSRVDASKHFHKNSSLQSAKLKAKLFRDGYKERKCEKCNLVRWNDQPAPLELDHINGDPTDNRLQNLRILCPNCHAQTSTNAGKNIRRCGGTAYTADLESAPARVASSNLAIGTNKHD